MAQEEARLLKEQQLIEDCTGLLIGKLDPWEQQAAKRWWLELRNGRFDVHGFTRLQGFQPKVTQKG